MTTILAVNGDGSGTIDHSLIVSKAALTQLRNFGALGAGRGQSIDLTSEEQARAMAPLLGPGVSYVASEPIDTPLGQGRHTRYAFADVTQVRISEQPRSDGLPIRPPEIAAHNGDITCALTHEPTGNAVLHINLPELNIPSALGDTTGNPALTQQLALIRTLLAGARISIGVEPAGQLVRTSSPFVEGPRVTLLEVDLDQVLGNQAVLARLQSAKTSDDVRAALTDVPGLKMTLDREVTIEFTAAK